MSSFSSSSCPLRQQLHHFLPFVSTHPYGSCSRGEEGDSHSHVLRDYALREFNALLWISLIAITALLLRKIFLLLRLWSKGCRIPGPPCPSFYGHSRLIGDNLIDFLSKSHEKYGSVVRLWLGPTQLLVSVKDPTMIKEMLVKAEDKLPLTGKAFHLAFGYSSLFVPSYAKVQRRRESLETQLNENLPERANAISLKVVDCVMGRIDSIMAKGVLDCKSISQHIAFCYIGATLFGDTFLDWSNATVYEELLMMIAKDACFWASYNVVPFWKKGFWKYRCLCARLKHLTQDLIQQRRQNYNLSVEIGHNFQNKTTTFERDVGISAAFSSDDVMTGGLFLGDPDRHHSMEEPCGNIMGVMFHGCLATAGLIGNILTRLVMHPEIQDKIYSEIDMVCKGSTKSENHDVQRMHFLLATVYESARLLPAGPLLQRCSLRHDLNLKSGVSVPAGAILVVPLQLVQMDGSSWGSDASQFNPYRFMSKAINQESPVSEFEEHVLDDPNENAAFLPFGSGTRACVGQKFAILAITTLFASLLQRYEVKLQPGSEYNPKMAMNDCVLQLLPSPKIVFVKRNS